MKTLTLVLVLITLTVCNSGCALFITQQQLRNKMPKIDGDISVKVTTIYGAAGGIKAENVKHRPDGSKTADSYEEWITSPIGGWEVEVKNGRAK